MTSTRETLLPLRLSAGEAVECLVDTEFTGALVLPQALVTRLKLPVVVRREVFEMVGGRQFVASAAFADVEWLGETRTVRVIVGDDTLLGTELLGETRPTIDYIDHTLSVSDEEG